MTKNTDQVALKNRLNQEANEKIVAYIIYVEVCKWFHEYWQKVALEEAEAEKEAAMEQRQSTVEKVAEKKKTGDDILLPEKQLSEKESEDLMNKLIVLYDQVMSRLRQYEAELDAHKLRFAAEASKYGYINEEKLNQCFDNVAEAVKKEVNSYHDPFIKDSKQEEVKNNEQVLVPAAEKKAGLSGMIAFRKYLIESEEFRKALVSGDITVLKNQRGIIDSLKQVIKEEAVADNLRAEINKRRNGLGNSVSAMSSNASVQSNASSSSPTPFSLQPQPQVRRKLEEETIIPTAQVATVEEAASLPNAEAVIVNSTIPPVSNALIVVDNNGHSLDLSDSLEPVGVATAELVECTKFFVENVLFPVTQHCAQAIDGYVENANQSLTSDQKSVIESTRYMLEPSAPPMPTFGGRSENDDEVELTAPPLVLDQEVVNKPKSPYDIPTLTPPRG